MNGEILLLSQIFLLWFDEFEACSDERRVCFIDESAEGAKHWLLYSKWQYMH